MIKKFAPSLLVMISGLAIAAPPSPYWKGLIDNRWYPASRSFNYQGWNVINIIDEKLYKDYDINGDGIYDKTIRLLREDVRSDADVIPPDALVEINLIGNGKGLFRVFSVKTNN